MAFDNTDPADLLALNTEMFTDPLALGYEPENTTVSLNIINAVSPSFTVSKPKISAAEIRSTCTYDAYNNLSIDEQEWIRWMTGSNGTNEENVIVTVDLRTQLTGPGLASIWAPANRDEMNAAMLDLIDVDGSRAEDLFGYATNITSADWIAAKNYTP